MGARNATWVGETGDRDHRGVVPSLTKRGREGEHKFVSHSDKSLRMVRMSSHSGSWYIIIVQGAASARWWSVEDFYGYAGGNRHINSTAQGCALPGGGSRIFPLGYPRTDFGFQSQIPTFVSSPRPTVRRGLAAPSKSTDNASQDDTMAVSTIP